MAPTGNGGRLQTGRPADQLTCPGYPEGTLALLCAKRQTGFTLFEIIIVVMIIAVSLTFATISIGNPQSKRIKQTSERITSLLQLAREQAIFNSQDYALSIWQSGYAFYTLNETGWVALTGERIFRARSLPAGLEFSLYLDGLKVILAQEDKSKPQIFITSDGEFSPFKLEITDRQEWLFTISFDETGEFAISPEKT